MTLTKLDGANTAPEERDRRSDAILADEHARQAENTEKIARLRELREARDTAERQTRLK
jgi:hypothetical protein